MRMMQTRRVVELLERIVPLTYADSTWDNVGLLLEGGRGSVSRVLLCTDMTEGVVQEARESDSDLIVSYHPPWFHATRRLTLDSTGPMRAVCIAAAAGISIYSPHTALDSIPNGISDWLADFFSIARKEFIVPCPGPSDGGVGRRLDLQLAIGLDDACKLVASKLCLSHLRVARSPVAQLIRSVAVCAGSGGSVLSKLATPVDLIVTGELTHHQVIGFLAGGTSVILTEHSNSERLYLESVYCEQLRQALGPSVQVLFSRVDQEPLQVFNKNE